MTLDCRRAPFKARPAARTIASCGYQVGLLSGLYSANDKQQVTPLLTALKALPDLWGEVTRLLADAGYCSAANVSACVNVGIEPLRAVGREAHHLSWHARFSEPPPLPLPTEPVARMKHHLQTRAGRAWYALRKQTVEPVFGIIKGVMGFRQFLLRGLQSASGRW